MPKAEVDEENARFAERLVALLLAAGHRRRGAGAYLARRYSVSTVTANAWLNGEHKPTVRLAKKIAADHAGRFDDLYWGPEQATPASPPRATTAQPHNTHSTQATPLPALTTWDRDFLARLQNLRDRDGKAAGLVQRQLESVLQHALDEFAKSQGRAGGTKRRARAR